MFYFLMRCDVAWGEMGGERRPCSGGGIEARAMALVCLPTMGNFGIAYFDEGDRSSDWRRPGFAVCVESALDKARFDVEDVDDCSSAMPVMTVADGWSIEEMDCSMASDVRGNNWKRMFFAFVALGSKPNPIAWASIPTFERRGTLELRRPE